MCALYIQVPHQRALLWGTSQTMNNGQYVITQIVLGAPDRVNIPCLMHDIRHCQLHVKMTHNSHGTKQIQMKKHVMM